VDRRGGYPVSNRNWEVHNL